MTISLIVSAYNEEKYIGDCLTYAIKNSHGKFLEIIVVDNASTDRTKEIARSFTDVKVVTELKKGPNHARQRGFLESRGDIIAFIDSDTRMPAGWVEAIEKEFSANPKLALLSGPYHYFDLVWWKRFLTGIYWSILALPAYLILGYIAVGGNFVIPRTMLEKMHGINTSISFYGDDTDIARRAHLFGKVKFKSSFIMYTSGRRFVKQGIFNTGTLYAINFISEVFWHKVTTKKHEDIR